MNILFITSTYLGDAVISSGILNHLITQNPDAKITVVAGPAPAPLFQDFPQVSQVISLHKQKHSWHWFQLWGQCIKTKWDKVVDVRGTGLSYFLWTKSRHVWKSSGAQDLRVHQLARWMHLDHTPDNKIWISPDCVAKAKHLMGNTPTVCISPAANWDKKCWPLQAFAELCKQLTMAGGILEDHQVAVFGAPNQRPDLQPFFDQFPQAVDLVGKADLPTIAACFAKSKVFIGNDSGLMHLAAAMGTKTLGLFGPSPENIYAPWGEQATYIRTPEPYEDCMAKAQQGQFVMQNLKVDEVQKAVKGLMG